MKLQLFELVHTMIGAQRGALLKEVRNIEWTEYDTNYRNSDSGYLSTQFESIEEFREKASKLFEKEHDDTFNLYGLSSSKEYTLLPIIKF